MADFDNETPTHKGATHIIPKAELRFKNQILKEVPKFLYPQNQHDLLNHCQIFKIKDRPHKKVIPNAVPGIQPNYSLTLKTYGPKTKASSKNLKPKKVKQEALVQKHAMVP